MQKYDWSEDGMQKMHRGDYYEVSEVDEEIADLLKRINDLEDMRTELQEEIAKANDALYDINCLAENALK